MHGFYLENGPGLAIVAVLRNKHEIYNLAILPKGTFRAQLDNIKSLINHSGQTKENKQVFERQEEITQQWCVDGASGPAGGHGWLRLNC